MITPAEWKFEEYHAAAAAAVQEDIKLNKLVYKLVPRKLTESDFWRLYFSEVLFVLDSVKAHGQYPPPVRAACQSHMRGTACLALSRSRARSLFLSLRFPCVQRLTRVLLHCLAVAAVRSRRRRQSRPRSRMLPRRRRRPDQHHSQRSRSHIAS